MIHFPFSKGWEDEAKEGIHGHIGYIQITQTIEPKIFFVKGKSYYLSEIRECWVSMRNSCGSFIQQQLFEPVTTII